MGDSSETDLVPDVDAVVVADVEVATERSSMSARKDKDQRITFVYSNLYKIYRDSKKQESGTEQNQAVAIPTSESDSRIIKVGDLKSGEISRQLNVSSYQPTELLGKKIEVTQKKEELMSALQKRAAAPAPAHEALEGLKQNLRHLNDLHSRLRFMLTELEDFMKK